MLRLHRLLVVALLLGGVGHAHAQTERDNHAAAVAPVHAVVPSLSYTRYVLPNGLTLVVHEDHKAPVVAVSVWYHVGSKNEPATRSGFAHLFEHLMFQGSENHNDEYFRPFELAGATDQNGTTWLDRTNYFQTVPSTAVDMALWMESDRMGHLLGAIGQAQIDEQRGVVQNEKRQGENQPYGRVFTVLQANAFPANHPYHHTTIGSMTDLNAAALDDVKNWFREYYGAANATVVLAGDITPEQAREKVLRHFGDIGPGPRLSRPRPWTAARTEATRANMPDKVPQTRIYREWNAPGLTDADATQIALATTVLGGGKTSRLYQRLVYQDQLADSVNMSVMPFELASMVML
ncbi:zinc protease [mine drainage metagenome]|uniref:Zinc protease n=1 Tax=mine drainage metagenome TaxID=410659 RepID=T1APG7_9ZZZZ